MTTIKPVLFQIRALIILIAMGTSVAGTAQDALPGFWDGQVTVSSSEAKVFLHMAPAEVAGLEQATVTVIGGYALDSSGQAWSASETGLEIAVKTATDAWRSDEAITITVNLQFSDRSELYEIEGLSVVVAKAPVSTPSAPQISIPLALLFALAGGLILNLMPCVFPILSLKALALAGSGGLDASARRSEGNAYTAGVLVSFLVIAGALLALRAGGEVIGWGFQLQNPVFVGFLAVIMTLVGLSLAGLFDISFGAEASGQGLASAGGRKGAFFTGVLATLVATPCTAPLMAPALGFALAQPAWLALLIFLTLGLGMALPFLLIAWVPAAGRMLPKPGLWMDRLKQGLAFPMFLTAVWLVYVYMQQIGSAGGLLLLIVLVVIGFAAWLWQQGSGILVRATSALFFVASLGVLVMDPLNVDTGSEASDQMFVAEPWSRDAVADMRADGKPVFVYFTADWCITCKFNERTAIYRAETAAYFAENGIKVLKGDWTNRNKVIAEELFAWGRAGVPLYLFYPAGGGDPVILPELLTQAGLIEDLEAAGK